MYKVRSEFPALSVLVLAAVVLFSVGCKKDDTPNRETEFDLMVQDVLGVTGKATFIETSKSSTTIKIELFGSPDGSHPAELRMNSAVEGGLVVVTLDPVVDNGSSSTKVTLMTYDELIAYDGFIRVAKSSSEPNVILAQGDIGGNVLTATKKTYTLSPMESFGVSGNALFEERVNGNTLVTITLIGTIAGETYPASINLSSTSTIGGGPVVNILSSVNGTTGMSYTNIRQLDSGIQMTYGNWMEYDGHINVYQNSMTFPNIICQGNIGSN
ncbi:MAG: hypothetical protein IH597_08035 [Bacteroidales bacterium]|nr:hypothetical protein [Bacteroidales bacterium]